MTKLSRAEAMDRVTAVGVEGGFFVRTSANSTAGLAMTVLLKGAAKNFPLKSLKIKSVGKAIQVPGSNRHFSSIDALVAEYIRPTAHDGIFGATLVVIAATTDC